MPSRGEFDDTEIALTPGLAAMLLATEDYGRERPPFDPRSVQALLLSALFSKQYGGKRRASNCLTQAECLCQFLLGNGSKFADDIERLRRIIKRLADECFHSEEEVGCVDRGNIDTERDQRSYAALRPSGTYLVNRNTFGNGSPAMSAPTANAWGFNEYYMVPQTQQSGQSIGWIDLTSPQVISGQLCETSNVDIISRRTHPGQHSERYETTSTTIDECQQSFAPRCPASTDGLPHKSFLTTAHDSTQGGSTPMLESQEKPGDMHDIDQLPLAPLQHQRSTATLQHKMVSEADSVDVNGTRSSILYGFQLPAQRVSPTEQVQQLYMPSEVEYNSSDHIGVVGQSAMPYPALPGQSWARITMAPCS